MKKTISYKWIILGTCFVMCFMTLGFCSSGKSLFLAAMTEALGIPRSLFSISDSCRYIATALVNLFFGSLLEKLGSRKLTAIGFLCLIASCLIYAWATQMVLFCIAGTMLGVGLALASTTMASSIVRRWFHKDIGKYMGIVFCANGVGGALSAQIFSPIIYRAGDAFGYRDAYILNAALMLVAGIIVVSLLRERPKDAPAVIPQTGGMKKPRGAYWDGIPFDQVKKRPYFYLAALSVFCCGFVLQGLSGTGAAHMKDVGLDADFVATVVSIGSLALTGTKLLVGFLYDHKGLRVTTGVCYMAAVIALLFMAMLNSSGVGRILAVSYILLYSLALPLETLVVPLIANDLFGLASYDRTLGILLCMNYSGYALGAPIFNLCFDRFGTYVPILWICCGVVAAVAAMFQLVIHASHKDKQQLIAEKGTS